MMRLQVHTLLVLLFLAPIAAAQTSVDQTKPVKPDGLVEVSNVAGSVEVIAWERAEVHVTGTMEKNVERLDFDVRDARTRINVVLPKHKSRDTSAYLTIHVPVGSELEIETVSASVTVDNTCGPATEQHVSADGKDIQAEGQHAQITATAPETISVQTVSGNVRMKARAQSVCLQAVSGDVSFRGDADRLKSETVSGDLDCSGAISSLAANTISGHVTANGIERDAEISTVSGETKLAFGMIRKAVLASVSGDIALDGPLAENGRICADTQSGSITIHFAGEVSAEFEADSVSGDIRAKLGGIIPSLEKTDSGSALRFSMDAGAGLVRLTTVSGDITLLGSSETPQAARPGT